ncbi:uncharacterized protein LOC129224973 [Uloborus diversus]|uniref:uncharacterized protein LOC129224973 n=1 Tax=Uloborus diversus TaxID=327109 RepID=UPI002409AF3B|nr:uncharacterized protein LOC129224973 [Uloborus diversus]
MYESFLNNLEELSLDHNNIHHIHPKAFSNLNKLTHLSISNNNLSELNLDIIQDLCAIRSLLLDDNNIESIDKKINTSSLITLRMKNNSLFGSLESNTLQGLSELQFVDLSFNHFNEIKPYVLSQQENLNTLNLSNNVVHIIQEHAFGALLNLTTLDLSNNQIAVIKITAFAKLRNLRVLNLSANRLSAIPCEYTLDLISLKKVFLNDNNIASITPGAFHISPGLTEIDLKGNTLECNCELASFASYIKNLTQELKNADDIICIQPSSSASVLLVNFNFDSCPVMDYCQNVSLFEENDSDDEYEDYDEDELTTTSSKTVSFMELDNATVPIDMTPITASTFSDSDDFPENNTLKFSESSFTTDSIVDNNMTTDTTIYSSTKEASHSTNGVTPTYSIVSTAEYKVSIIILNFSVESSGSCINWTVNEMLPSDAQCIFKFFTAEGTKSKLAPCPKSAYDPQNKCFPYGDVPSFCILIPVGGKRFKSCANNSKSSTESTVYSHATPTVTMTMEHALDYSEKISTYSVSLIPTENITEHNLPDVKMHIPLDSDVPHNLFNVTKFDVRFNSSIVYVQWNVSRKESESLCKLTLTIQSAQRNSEEKFSCSNNSFVFLNKNKQEWFKVCLQVFHKLNTSIMCKYASVLEVAAEASKSKDYGYQTSSLIPLICLFAIVMFIVILIVIRNIYKKQLISKRYDVREREKNIQQTISSSTTEQSVRYSYIANKHI